MVENLESCWKDCLDMWKSIADTARIKPELNIAREKALWLYRNHKRAYHNCFFCQYAINVGSPRESIDVKGYGCRNCPGVLVDASFDCGDDYYDYEEQPILFYEKLVELNKKRKKEK